MAKSPAAVLFDADGNEVLVSSDGVRAVVIRDPEQLEVLKDIRTQMRKMNFYLAQIVDQELPDEALEDGS